MSVITVLRKITEQIFFVKFFLMNHYQIDSSIFFKNNDTE